MWDNRIASTHLKNDELSKVFFFRKKVYKSYDDKKNRTIFLRVLSGADLFIGITAIFLLLLVLLQKKLDEFMDPKQNWFVGLFGTGNTVFNSYIAHLRKINYAAGQKKYRPHEFNCLKGLSRWFVIVHSSVYTLFYMYRCNTYASFVFGVSMSF